MESVDRRLVRRDARLIQLLDPPFDKSDLNPGYIKGYVPGVRENGGQYTHAAIWTVMAFAAMGDSRRAWELFALINPVTHGDTPEAIATYRVEPYVVAADVYAVAAAHRPRRLDLVHRLGRLDVPAHHRIAAGLAIWTWTSSASRPAFPPDWPSFKIHYRYRETVYHITLRNGGAGSTVKRVVVDGNEQPEKCRAADRRPERPSCGGGANLSRVLLNSARGAQFSLCSV